MRLERGQINEIKRLRKQGNSLYEICYKTGLKKTTVYYHIKKHFGRSYKKVNFNLSNQELLGEIIGVFAGDGNYCKDSRCNHQVRFYFSWNEKVYSKRFAEVLSFVFGKDPYIYNYERKIEVRYKSKEMYEFLLQYLWWKGKRTHSIKLRSIKNSKDFTIGFLRGFFDAEGYSHKNQKKIVLVTTSKSMYKQLVEILRSLKFIPLVRIYKDKRPNNKTCYYITLRDKNAVDFINIIKPRNPKRIKAWGP
ncbi:MAG: LAGLIDADG family homing endonuclease [Candidatus Aenigmatarchaeota archaeon]